MIEYSTKRALYFDPVSLRFDFKQNEDESLILYTIEEKRAVQQERYNHNSFDTQAKFGLDSNGRFAVVYSDRPLEEKKNIIRKKRKECFAIINRGNAWYNTLSSIQKTELDAWYQEWLSATDTLNLPIKPDWLV